MDQDLIRTCQPEGMDRERDLGGWTLAMRRELALAPAPLGKGHIHCHPPPVPHPSPGLGPDWVIGACRLGIGTGKLAGKPHW